jgi:hypothetical protein
MYIVDEADTPRNPSSKARLQPGSRASLKAGLQRGGSVVPEVVRGGQVK